MEKKIAFICDDARNFLVRSLITELESAEYSVSIYSTTMNAYDFIKTDFCIFIVYLDGFNEFSEKLLTDMQLVMSDKNSLRRLYIIGTDEDVKQSYNCIDVTLITHVFKRPVNMESIIRELNIINPSYTYDDSLTNIEGKTVHENRKTIMIVDDDDIYLRTIETWFSDEYNVYTAASATSAISMLNKISFDLILLDYEMPLLSGLDFLRIIRSEDKTKDLPIIFLTGKDDKETVMEILKDKPTGYLLKTTAPILLKYNIRQFFAGKSIWWKNEQE